MRPRTRRLAALTAATVLGLIPVVATGAPAWACPPLEPSCTSDATRPAWFYGQVVTQYVQYPAPVGSGPAGPTPERPDTTIFLVGNVGATPFAPEQQIPGGPVVPDHDHVWITYPLKVSDGYGLMVVAGPNGDTATVRTRRMPAGSIAGAPLAYQIRLGGQWYDLDNAAIIRQGIDLGLLRTVDIGWGGTGWIEYRH